MIAMCLHANITYIYIRVTCTFIWKMNRYKWKDKGKTKDVDWNTKEKQRFYFMKVKSYNPSSQTVKWSLLLLTDWIPGQQINCNQIIAKMTTGYVCIVLSQLYLLMWFISEKYVFLYLHAACMLVTGSSYLFVFVCMNVCVCMHVCVCVFMCVCVYVHTCMCINH